MVDTSGQILMGARLYNSVTGLFTSRDAVEGRNTSSITCAYQQDSVRMSDITGLWRWSRRTRTLGRANLVAGFIPGPADLDYQGTSGMTPCKKGNRHEAGALIRHDRKFNKGLSQCRAAVERSDTHLKNRKMLSEIYRGCSMYF